MSFLVVFGQFCDVLFEDTSPLDKNASTLYNLSGQEKHWAALPHEFFLNLSLI